MSASEEDSGKKKSFLCGVCEGANDGKARRTDSVVSKAANILQSHDMTAFTCSPVQVLTESERLNYVLAIHLDLVWVFIKGK